MPFFISLSTARFKNNLNKLSTLTFFFFFFLIDFLYHPLALTALYQKRAAVTYHYHPIYSLLYSFVIFNGFKSVERRVSETVKEARLAHAQICGWMSLKKVHAALSQQSLTAGIMTEIKPDSF